jgi:hypothetical protein
MNDIAFYASDIAEGIMNLFGVLLFFIFVLPPFLVVFVPLLILSSSVIMCGVGVYISYILCSISWDLAKSFLFWLWTGQSVPTKTRPRRGSAYTRQDLALLSDLADLDKTRRQSAFEIPRRIAQPRSRSGSMHLKKSDSMRSLVGPSSDHDFEDTGGWANSHEDDEAMYMARSVGVSEGMYSPVLYHSETPHGHQTPSGARTPATISRPVSRGEVWKLGPNGTGATTPKAYRSGTVTPESYFSIPAAQGKTLAFVEQPYSGGPSAQYAHRKNNSSSSILASLVSADGKASQRDSGFFG